jgi:hypothetical protein
MFLKSLANPILGVSSADPSTIMTNYSNVTNTNSLSSTDFSTPVSLVGYYLRQDYARNDGTYVCRMKAAYMTTPISSSYNVSTSDSPLVLNMTFVQDMGVPFNITVMDASINTVFSTSGTWYSIDYINFDAEGYILVTFDPLGTRSTTERYYFYELNFKVCLQTFFSCISIAFEFSLTYFIFKWLSGFIHYLKSYS